MADPQSNPLAFRIADATHTLARRNPNAPRADIRHAGRLIASVGEAVLGLPIEQQKLLLERKDELRAVIGRLAGAFLVASETGHATPHGLKINVQHRRVGGAIDRVPIAARPDARQSVAGKPEDLLAGGVDAVERHRGKGFGPRVGKAEGARRLAAYAMVPRVEDWAGPVAGPGELESEYGIARSTLQDWRNAGAVVGLLKGTRKHVFPLAQFVDGRPVRGLAALRAIIGDSRATWLWLVEPYADGATPLDGLKNGEVGEILEAARADFA